MRPPRAADAGRRGARNKVVGVGWRRLEREGSPWEAPARERRRLPTGDFAKSMTIGGWPLGIQEDRAGALDCEPERQIQEQSCKRNRKPRERRRGELDPAGRQAARAGREALRAAREAQRSLREVKRPRGPGRPDRG